MQKITKKEIRLAVEDAIGNVPKKLGISEASKKTKKLVAKVSKKLSGRFKKEVKKHNSKTAKVRSNGKQTKPKKAAPSKQVANA